MKKLLKKVHLWVSVPVGLIISLVCLSGAALVFEPEITRMVHPEWWEVNTVGQPEARQLMTPDQLVRRIKQQVPDSLTVSALEFRNEPGATVWVSFAQTGRKTLVVNGYTGEVTGWKTRLPFFNAMFQLHRWLFDAPKERTEKTPGRLVVGVSMLCMVAILLSGIWIWWPKNLKGLKNQQRMYVRRGFKRFANDTHKVLGIYAVIFLLLMTLTGLTWSFGWYRSAVLALFGVEQSQGGGHGHGGKEKGERGGKAKHGRGEKPGKHRQEHEGGVATVDFSTWNKALAAVKTKYSDYSSVKVEAGEVAVNRASANAMKKEDTWKFDTQTGALTECTTYEQLKGGRKAQGYIYALHTGSWGGLLMRWLYFFAAFLGGTLPLSGYWMWWQRVQKRKKR